MNAKRVVAMLRDDAVEWSAENGLKGRLSATVEATECGFRVWVENEAGGAALCVYTAFGARSMYERRR